MLIINVTTGDYIWSFLIGSKRTGYWNICFDAT